MSDHRDNVVPHAKVRSLREAIRSVRVKEMEQSDAVLDLQENERTRLELLSEELQDVFREIPENDQQFALKIMGGSQPRLWIDMTAHVVMARNHSTYRFVKDTRLGRVVLLESGNLDDMADCITHYIAQRIIERERMLDSDVLLAKMRGVLVQEQEEEKPSPQAQAVLPEKVAQKQKKPREEKLERMGFGLSSFLIGFVTGALGLAVAVLFYFGAQ
ncbi:hypothetical protein [Polycladidibacter stylochi]|uniref:hypothetical protein n=1 Tax=Polycladidibacter stylochi TaxID=1807766 RepID=UPI000831DD7C|nr:hypothetical protein [Pseudovibrio stylochi]